MRQQELRELVQIILERRHLLKDPLDSHRLRFLLSYKELAYNKHQTWFIRRLWHETNDAANPIS